MYGGYEGDETSFKGESASLSRSLYLVLLSFPQLPSTSALTSQVQAHLLKRKLWCMGHSGHKATHPPLQGQGPCEPVWHFPGHGCVRQHKAPSLSLCEQLLAGCLPGGGSLSSSLPYCFPQYDLTDHLCICYCLSAPLEGSFHQGRDCCFVHCWIPRACNSTWHIAGAQPIFVE